MFCATNAKGTFTAIVPDTCNTPSPTGVTPIP